MVSHDEKSGKNVCGINMASVGGVKNEGSDVRKAGGV